MNFVEILVGTQIDSRKEVRRVKNVANPKQNSVVLSLFMAHRLTKSAYILCENFRKLILFFSDVKRGL